MIAVSGEFEVCPTNLYLTHSLSRMHFVWINFTLGFRVLSYDFEFFLCWKLLTFPGLHSLEAGS